MQLQNQITTDCYFITDTVVDWVDIFTRPTYKHIIVDSLRFCQEEKGLIIHAWVLMSNHLHMVVSSLPEYNISDTLRDFKKFTSKEIIRTLLTDMQESRQEWMLNRFEYAGLNDKKIKNYKFWKENNDVQNIYSYDFFMQKLNYIHENPIKAEIVDNAEDYKYSSAVNYAGEKGLLDVAVI